MTTLEVGTETIGSTPGHQLGATLLHALSLAGKTWDVQHLQAPVEEGAHRTNKLARVAPHLVGYGTLLGHLVYQHQREGYDLIRSG